MASLVLSASRRGCGTLGGGLKKWSTGCAPKLSLSRLLNASTTSAQSFSSFGNQNSGGGGNNNPRDRPTATRRLARSQLLRERQEKQLKFSWDPKTFGLRRNAVTVFPGDFGDNDQLKEGAERRFKEEGKQSFEDAQSEGIEKAKKVQAIMREQEKAREEKRRANLEKLFKPKKHETKIDDRGLVYSRGGRKAASARIWMTAGTGEITVNKQDYADYFIRESTRTDIVMPFVVTDTLGQFDVVAAVRGGGLSGQAGAIRYGIAHCLNRWNPDLYRAPLKFKKYLRRDNRIVEKKKVGHVKARKRKQWNKR